VAFTNGPEKQSKFSESAAAADSVEFRTERFVVYRVNSANMAVRDGSRDRQMVSTMGSFAYDVLAQNQLFALQKQVGYISLAPAET
jgi:hypothetical protein